MLASLSPVVHVIETPHLTNGLKTLTFLCKIEVYTRFSLRKVPILMIDCAILQYSKKEG